MENSQTKNTREEQHAKAVPNTKPGYLFCKRAFDIAASLAVLILLSPIYLLTAIAIYIDDPGPVIYSNALVGKNGEKFRIYKFRSMYLHSEEIDVSAHEDKSNAGITFKLANDPRVTRVGHFIRRAGIDELPQMVNILRGDMSLVGPRPLPPYADAQLPSYARQRYLVRGGLLCYWQISDRSKITLEQWMDMDIRYINEASLWIDLKIILATFPALFTTIWKNY